MAGISLAVTRIFINNIQELTSMKKLMRILLRHVIIGMAMIYFVACSSSSNLWIKSAKPNTRKYKLRPGDVIEIKFGYYPDFNQTIMIAPNGTANLRALGEIKISGLTLEALESLLNEKYGNWLVEPNLKVIIRESSKYTVYIGGEVLKPGLLSFKGNLTVVQAILMAGGLKDKITDLEVLIFRNQGTEGVKMYKIKLKEKALGKQANRNFKLAPYDVIFVLKTSVGKSKPGRLI